MTICFYRLDRAEGPPPEAPPRGASVRIWRPAEDGLPPPGPSRAENLIWWGFSLTGVFLEPEFTEISLWRNDLAVSRLIVTPGWGRFPFMRRGDLQIGGVWTRPDLRGQGFARSAIGEAHRICLERADRFWYVVEAGNTPSIRLIESFGYRQAGVGRRTSPFGLGALGRFRLDEPAV